MWLYDFKDLLRCKCECNIDVLNCGKKSTGIKIIPWKLSLDKASLRLSVTLMHVEHIEEDEVEGTG